MVTTVKAFERCNVLCDGDRSTCPPSHPAPGQLRRFLCSEEVPWTPDPGRVGLGKQEETASVPHTFSLQPWSPPLEAQATVGAAATAVASPMAVAAEASVPPVAATWVAAPPACASSPRRHPPRRVIGAKEPHLPLLPPPSSPDPQFPAPRPASLLTPLAQSQSWQQDAQGVGKWPVHSKVHPSASRQVPTEGPHSLPIPGPSRG